MKKNVYFVGICILLISLGFFVINESILSFSNSNNNSNEISGLILKELPLIGQEIAWDTNGNPVCITSNDQDSSIACSDGVGGAIVTWLDDRNGNYDIFAQHINSEGQVEWEINGTAICTADSSQTWPRICSDGAGGAIITWQDYRNTYGDIYAQHINSDGIVRWDANGTAICDEDYDQLEPEICSDEAGGAIIAWRDKRNGVYNNIYAQRINSEGQVEWGNNGTAISIAASNQWHSELCCDGAGGAIITWQDYRGGADYDIYAQHINSDGILRWDANGTVICDEDYEQSFPKICSDGVGGAIITWKDERSGTYEGDIYAQHINSDGIVQWDVNGTIICVLAERQEQPEICSDGAGGAIITWMDLRNGDDYDIYAQHIDSNGTLKWGDSFTDICDTFFYQGSPRICSDGEGGAIITWQDERSGENDIYAQHINSKGIVLWPNNGFTICIEDEIQSNPEICSDGAGGAIITWKDQRNGNIDIYAQKISSNSPPTSNHPADIITSMKSSETIDWILYDDSGGGQYRVMANNTVGSYYVVLNWTSWTNGSVLHAPINRTSSGVFEYKIEYYDNQNRFGIPDTVMVQITRKSSINGYSIYILSLSVCIIGLIFVIRLKRNKNLIK